MRCPTIPLLPILPGLFSAHELQFSLPADSMSMLVLLYIAVDVGLFVCMFIVHRYKGIFKNKWEKNSMQRRRRRTKEKRIEAIARFKKENKNRKNPQASCVQPNSIPLRNKRYTERRYYCGGSQKNQTPAATITTLSSLFCQQHQKRVCEGERGKANGARREERDDWNPFPTHHKAEVKKKNRHASKSQIHTRHGKGRLLTCDSPTRGQDPREDQPWLNSDQCRLRRKD